MTFIAAGVTAAATIGGAAMSANASRNAAQAAKQPKYLRVGAKNLVSRAEDISTRPYEAYTGARVAGLSGLETQAGQLAGSLSGRYQPMIDRAGAKFDPSALEQFENPYMSKVVQGRLDDVGRAYDTQLGGLNRKRGMMDAFGTDRGSMLETSLMRERGRETDRVSNEGRAASYQSALDSYFRDKQSALSAAQTGGNIDQNAVSSMLEAGGRERSIGQAQSDFDYGQFLESRDWNVNNLKPLMEAIRTAQGSAPSSTPTGTDYGSLLSGLGTTLAGVVASSGGSKSTVPSGASPMSGLSDISITAQRIGG